MIEWLPWLFPVVTLAISLLMVRRDIRWKKAEKLQTVATVIGHTERSDSDGGSSTYAMRLRFRTVDGRTVETSDHIYVLRPPAVGQALPLWYDRARPEIVFHTIGGMGVGTYLFLIAFNLLAVAFSWAFIQMARH